MDAKLNLQLVLLRKNSPWMFGHPEAKPDEIYIGRVVADVMPHAIAFYERKGFNTVRFTQTKCGSNGWYWPVFVELEEYLTLMVSDANATLAVQQAE